MKKLELVKSAPVSEATLPSPGAAPAIVKVVDVPEPGHARVLLPDGSEVPARLTAGVSARAPESLLGREALAVFEGNDPGRPVILDLVGAAEGFADRLDVDMDDDAALDARVDGRNVVIQADRRLELRCGKASIVIDADGKISLKGATLYNRATGPIRIKGGHVDIN